MVLKSAMNIAKLHLPFNSLFKIVGVELGYTIPTLTTPATETRMVKENPLTASLPPAHTVKGNQLLSLDDTDIIEMPRITQGHLWHYTH